MDNLQWFKFNPSNWMMGKIMRCPETTQARFLRLCCLYWNKDCSLSYEDAEIEVDDEHLKTLMKKKIIDSDGEYIFIEFLNIQFSEIEDTKIEKSKSGKIGNLKRWHPNAYSDFQSKKISLSEALKIAEQSHTDRTPIAPPSQNIAEKRREEKKREEKKRKDIIISPPKVPFGERVNKFLDWFNSNKEKHTGKIGKFKVLTSTDEKNLKALTEKYDNKEFTAAIPNLFKNQWARDSGNLTPSHFLRIENFNKYLNQDDSKPNNPHNQKSSPLKNTPIEH